MSRKQRWRWIRKSSRVWLSSWLPVVGGLVGGLLLALTVAEIEATARGLTPFNRAGSLGGVWAFAFGALAVALPLVLIQHVARSLTDELRAMVNVRPLTGDRLLGHDPWAMDAAFAEQILGVVDEGHESIVELGAGHSTLLIAERLEQRGAGHVTAVDHLADYAERTRGWLRDAGLDHRATVIHAPVVEGDVEGTPVRWYAREALDDRLPKRIDLLIVDGPPDLYGKDARWPAVPVLRERLGPGAAILMDDGDRPDERRAAHDWHARLGGRIRYTPGGKGSWLLRTPTA